MAPSGASEEATPVADTSAGAPAMANASNNSESPQLMQPVVSAHPSLEPASTSRTSKYDRETCFILQMLGAIGRCCGLGKGGLCRRWLTYLERLDVSWTCAEDRSVALDKQTLSTMKHTYWLSRIIFLRLLSLVYFFAFLVAFKQNGGLLGSSGITPASSFVSETKNAFGDVRGWERIKALPSLFLFVPPTDSWLGVFSFIGLSVSAGIFVLGGASALCLGLLWLLYLSLVSVGQVWYSFGWESQLLETGFLGIWLSPFWSCSRFPLSWPVPKVCIWGSRWLLLRLLLGAGLSMLRRDSTWAALTALDFHFETQPLPTPFAWYLHNQPHWLHAAEAVLCLLMHCVVPFLTVLPSRPCRLLGGSLLVIYQLFATVCGNVAFAHYLTLVPAVMCLDDCFLSCLFSAKTLSRMPKLTTGVAGRWSFPLTQGWPLDKETTTNKDRDEDEERDTPQAIDEEAQTLLEKQPREGADGSGASTARPRSCCCYYWPDVVEWLEARRLPRGSVDSMQRHLATHWWQSLVEGLVSAAVLWCSWLVATPDTYAVWAVLCLFFLALLQASFSAFVTRTTTSFVFTELVLSVATLVSFSNMFTYGPEVWSVWLTSCLVTILAIFSFSTLRNAALVTKLHIEVLLLTLLIVLSIPVVQNLLSPQQVTDASFEPFQVLNTYGALGKIQKERYELVVQGTDDEKLTIDTKWQNYEFQCKPTSLHKAPCYSGPYHHRLDWLMRLVALEEKQSALSHHEWFPKFLSALLKNNSYVTGLLRHNPFREEPPTHIRVLRAEYHFTKRKSEGLIFSNGPWWEIRRGSTKVFMEPHEVPGAQSHLQKVLAERAERRRVAEAAAAAAAAARRRREEEEELWRRVVEAKRAAEKLKRQQEEQQKREKERREVEEKERREAAAKAQAAAAEAQRATEEAERKTAEEKKRKEEEAEAARKAQQEAAAKAEAERRAVELENQKEKERRQEAQRQQQEAAEKQRHVEKLAKAGELQRQREEEKRRHELAAEEAERRRKQEAQRQKEEQQRQQQLAERQAKLEEEQKQKMERIQQLLISITKQVPGGVPLREAARLSRKTLHRAAAAMLKSE